MKAVQANLLNFLRVSPQFVIPIYQRTYSWTERECRQLWEDILRAGRSDSIQAHFVGSIVYIQDSGPVTMRESLLVIDGQQRLTTVSLLLEALAQILGDDEPVDGFSTPKIRSYFLLNPLERGDRKYKLILSQTDRDSLCALVDQRSLPREYSIRIEANFGLFKKWLHEAKSDLAAVCKGLSKLLIVDISLDRNYDNPQLIFESLNSTGRELSQADLIRNFVLMRLDTDLQSRLYTGYWRPMETDFGQEGYVTHFDGFMRHYLTVKTGEIPNINSVYEAFKKHAEKQKAAGVEALVSDVRVYAGYYCAVALCTETDPDLKMAFEDIRELRVDVAYPLLLELYHDYRNQKLSKKDLLEAARLIESYVFRRAVCGIPPNSLNKTFATFTRDLKKDRYLESLKAVFLLLPSYRRFPDDEEFQRELQRKDLYNFRSRSYWLRRVENFERKERVSLADYTIEHIMPQNENLSPAWKAELGPDWERIHKDYLHTLGNLTLTAYNSEYSDRSFEDKRERKGGFAQSPLHLNEAVRNVVHWTESAMQNRAASLAGRAVNVWPFPQLDQAVLDSYRPRRSNGASYSLADHPFLSSERLRPVFEEFRKQVLALDPCVVEEFLKFWVAYKAETNFVDIIPMSQKIRLSINIPFGEIQDPQRLGRDVTNLGHYGNGDVEVEFASLSEIPYIMSLVRQAFERQMDSLGD